MELDKKGEVKRSFDQKKSHLDRYEYESLPPKLNTKKILIIKKILAGILTLHRMIISLISKNRNSKLL